MAYVKKVCFNTSKIKCLLCTRVSQLTQYSCCSNDQLVNVRLNTWLNISALCAAGTYQTTVDDIVQCMECELGHYSNESSALNCRACDTDKTTFFKGSDSESDCVGKCIFYPTIAAIFDRNRPCML